MTRGSPKSAQWFLLVALVPVAAGCRREEERLAGVQKMAYSVKPAVVRVNAYAKGEFRYPASAIEQVEALIAKEGTPLAARGLPQTEGAVETGVGGSGSGFIIHPDGFILTSGHVVAPTRDAAALRRELLRNGAIAALVRHFARDGLRALYRGEGLERHIALVAAAGRLEGVSVVNDVELSNGERLPFRIRRYSPSLPEGGTDLALLEVKRRNLPALRLGDSASVRVGDAIWSIGYPAVASSSDEVIGGWLSRESDLEPTVNPGNITAIKTDAVKRPVFQSNVAIYRGNSGGPAVNLEGDAIAVSTWGHTSAEQIKFLVPIEEAKNLLAAAKVPVNVEGDFNRHYRAALASAQKGKWVAAKESLESASRFFPRSPDVIRFRADIDRALATLPAWRRHPVVAGSVGAAALVAVIVALLLLLPHRRRIPKDLSATTTVETIVAPDGVAASAQSMIGKFTILNGTRAGQKLGLGGSGIRIGRESAICEIVLENPKVSRLHAEVVSIDGKVLLIDRNSSNGTYVNDQKIDRRYLKDGDIIYFGGRNAVAVAFHA
ncbi:MAG TPA: trypsin-like peptidase domain-containing protein [Thermoanaerobaculia bacterium]|nr:trypsin-like peptidase domain-containing protein [Thermoanaerobaculia bacterium]